jgi:lipopolysaccharide export system protein LptA
MARLIILATLTCCLCRPVAANAQPPSFLDQLVIKGTASGVEIRHPTLNATASTVTFNQKKGEITLYGTAATPVALNYPQPMQETKRFRGEKIVISLKDGSLQTIEQSSK